MTLSELRQTTAATRRNVGRLPRPVCIKSNTCECRTEEDISPLRHRLTLPPAPLWRPGRHWARQGQHNTRTCGRKKYVLVRDEERT